MGRCTVVAALFSSFQPLVGHVCGPWLMHLSSQHSNINAKNFLLPQLGFCAYPLSEVSTTITLRCRRANVRYGRLIPTNTCKKQGLAAAQRPSDRLRKKWSRRVGRRCSRPKRRVGLIVWDGRVRSPGTLQLAWTGGLELEKCAMRTSCRQNVEDVHFRLQGGATVVNWVWPGMTQLLRKGFLLKPPE